MTKKNNLKKKNDSDGNDSLMNENRAWDKDNQAWWDWYVSLADNSSRNKKKALIKLPDQPKIKFPSLVELKQELSMPYNLSLIHI